MTDSKRMFLPTPIQASLLSGATQVSTPVKPQPAWNAELEMWTWPNVMNGYASCYPTEGLVDWLTQHCPFPVGTEVWVPETWNARDVVYDDYCGGFEAGYPLNPIPRVRPDFRYVVDYKATDGNEGPWRPAITMPSWAARLRYIIEGVKVEKEGDDNYGTFMWVYTYTVRSEWALRKAGGE